MPRARRSTATNTTAKLSLEESIQAFFLLRELATKASDDAISLELNVIIGDELAVPPNQVVERQDIMHASDDRLVISNLPNIFATSYDDWGATTGPSEVD